MKVFHNLDAGHDISKGCVLAAGNFDGVHKGHQMIFETAVETAHDEGLKAVLLTFSRHPAAFIRPDEAPHPLMAVQDRLTLAERAGFDTAFVLEFNKDLAALSPAEFVEEMLVKRLMVKFVVAGESWRFGHGRKGDMAMLGSYGKRVGFETKVVEPCMAQGEPVSSTRIRKILADGDVAAAGDLLGRLHFIRGKVVSGRRRGRELGFPTVNLDCSHTMVPGEGVYAGGYRIGRPEGGNGRGMERPGPAAENAYGPAAVNIGSSPTFKNSDYALEAHLVGWDGDLYGVTVTIAFVGKIRDQYLFPSASYLSEQMARDVKFSASLFDANVLEEIPF